MADVPVVPVVQSAPIMETRWPCPVCLGVIMEKVALGNTGGRLILDHCTRCGGVFFEHGEAQRLAGLRPDELWRVVAPRRESLRPPCHGCGAPLDRDAEKCEACGRKNTIACPSCDSPMERVPREGLALDACRKCRGVWFDNAELKSVWSLNLSLATARQQGRAGQALAVGGDVLLESFFWAPGLVIHGAMGAAHVAGSAIGALGSVSPTGAANAAMGAAEVVGSAAEGVFETIMELISSIFD